MPNACNNLSSMYLGALIFLVTKVLYRYLVVEPVGEWEPERMLRRKQVPCLYSWEPFK